MGGGDNKPCILCGNKSFHVCFADSGIDASSAAMSAGGVWNTDTSRLVVSRCNRCGLAFLNHPHRRNTARERQCKNLPGGAYAFENDKQTINPPGVNTVERAEELAKQIDALIVKDNVVNETLDLASEAFKLFNSIQEV